MGRRALEGLRRLTTPRRRGREGRETPWFKVSDAEHAGGERALVHDGRNDRMEVGRRVGGRWFVENPADGRLTEIVGVTHWGPLPDSEEYDPADD